MQASAVGDLHDALRDGERFATMLAGRRPPAFLDYDGVLTLIVDRPEVGHPDDPEGANRLKPPNCVLESTVEVEKFLGTLAR